MILYDMGHIKSELDRVVNGLQRAEITDEQAVFLHMRLLNVAKELAASAGQNVNELSQRCIDRSVGLREVA